MKYGSKVPIPTLCECKDKTGMETDKPYIRMREGYIFKLVDPNTCEEIEFAIFRHDSIKRWVISCMETGRQLFVGRPSMPRDWCVRQFQTRYFSHYCMMRSDFFDGKKQALFKNMKQEFQDALKRYAKVVGE